MINEHDAAVIPDIRELLAYINNGFGGTQEYANMLVDDVKAATAGSTPRLSFHNNYLTAIAKFGGDDDLANSDLDMLEAEAAKIVAAKEKNKEKPADDQ